MLTRLDIFLHAIAAAFKMKGTIYQIDSSGEVAVLHVGTLENQRMECFFARMQVVHIDPVIDNLESVKVEAEVESLSILQCPYCHKSSGGPKRLKRHILNCTPIIQAYNKPFQVQVVVPK